MGGSGVSGSVDVGDVRRKQRTITSRRPRSNAQILLVHETSPPSSTPSDDDEDKRSPDGSNDYSQKRKELSMSNPVMNPASSKTNDGIASKKFKKDDKRFGNLEDLYRVDSLRNESHHSHQRQNTVKSKHDEGTSGNRRVIKGTPRIHLKLDDAYDDKIDSNHNGVQSIADPHKSTESKPGKVKLKVGGVTRTINAKSSFLADKLDSSSTKHSLSHDAPQHKQKHHLQENSGNGLPPAERRGDLQLNRTKKHSRDIVVDENHHGKRKEKLQDIISVEPVRKSQRVQNRRLLDDVFDSANEDKEMRHGKFMTPTASTDNSDEIEEGTEDSFDIKQSSKVPKAPRNLDDVDGDYDLAASKENRKRSRRIGESFDGEYIEEEELCSDDEPDLKKKKPKKDHLGSSTDSKPELLTARQRALQSGKGTREISTEFPNELPPTSRRAKVKLSAVEQEAKRAEAAQRRRIQVEKQDRESQAEAIRKILGQDSSRKKKEYKKKEKDAESLVLMPSTIRWVTCPTGTVITFADDVGLPSILNSKKCSYPPSREKCAGPSCKNAYKYRDSKSNLPLCSLECYRAVRKGVQEISTC